MLATIFSLGFLALTIPSLSNASSEVIWNTPKYPNNYDNNTNISDTIHVDGDRMVLIVNGVIESGYDFIYINDEEYSGEFNNHLIPIDSNQVDIRFISDYSIQHQGISIKAVSGRLWTTPNYRRGYTNSTDISKTISLPDADSIKLTLQGETEEYFDFLTINGEKYHGQFINLEVNIPNNQVNIRFTSDYSVVTPGAAVLIEPVKKPLTDTELQSHFHRRLTAQLGEVAAATGVAATINGVCTSLGAFALLDPEPGTKVTAAVADGACWLVAAGAAVGTYIVAKVSHHSDSTSALKVEHTETVSPPIYDDGITQITSIPIGQSYKIIRSRHSLHKSYLIDPGSEYYLDAKILAEHHQNQEALSRIQQYIKNEDRHIAIVPCHEPQTETSRGRRLEVIHYCLEPINARPDRNAVANLELPSHDPRFLIWRDEEGTGSYLFYSTSSSYLSDVWADDSHSQVAIQTPGPGALFDIDGRYYVQPGDELIPGHEFIFLNTRLMSDFAQIVEWSQATNIHYIAARGIINVMLEEIDNPDLFEWNPRQIGQTLGNTLYLLDAYARSGSSHLGEEVVVILDHFTRAYQLGEPNTRLNRRQLMVLCILTRYLGMLPLDVIQPIRAELEQFAQSTRTTSYHNIVWDDPSQLTGYRRNRDIVDDIMNKLRNLINNLNPNQNGN